MPEESLSQKLKREREDRKQPKEPKKTISNPLQTDVQLLKDQMQVLALQVSELQETLNHPPILPGPLSPETPSIRVDEESINVFLDWLKHVDPKKYVGQQSLLTQLQKYGKNSRIKDVFSLFRIFLQQEKSI